MSFKYSAVAFVIILRRMYHKIPCKFCLADTWEGFFMIFAQQARASRSLDLQLESKGNVFPALHISFDRDVVSRKARGSKSEF